METVELKAWHNGLLNELLLFIPSLGAWDQVWSRVEARLEQAKVSSMLAGAQLTVDLGARELSQTEIEWLIHNLRVNYGILMIAVVTTDNVTREAAQRLFLNVYFMAPGGGRTDAIPQSRSNALYLPQTIRSGQRIEHDGHLVIAGDVNAGAEVIAVGDIVVAGALRGLAHAGSRGNEASRIFAGYMRPHQLRIAGQIARSPEEDATGSALPRRPEVARIENGTIQVYAV